WKSNSYHARPYRSYPDLAIQKIGGANPQGISQLTSQRRGQNYLLPSLPPVRSTLDLKPPLRLDSIFKRFERSAEFWVKTLRDFLESDPAANAATRNRRDGLLAGLLDELHIFSVAYHD